MNSQKEMLDMVATEAVEDRQEVEVTLASTLKACRDFGFSLEITAETCWNEGYRLGRQRWHWGPWWWVNVIGWFNTQKQKLFKRD